WSQPFAQPLPGWRSLSSSRSCFAKAAWPSATATARTISTVLVRMDSSRVLMPPILVAALGKRGESLPLRVDPVLEAAESLDLDLDPVAGLQEFVAPGAPGGGGSGEDELARVQRRQARKVRDLLGGGKDHAARVRVLLEDTVHPEPDREVLRIRHL